MHSAFVALQRIGHVDKDSRTHRHERVSAQAGCTLSYLTFQADQAAEDKG